MKRVVLASLFGVAAVLTGVSAIAAQPAAGTSAKSATLELAAQAQRPRVTIYPRRRELGPDAKRQCRAQLVQEYRVSGTVIVPRMTCWWE